MLQWHKRLIAGEAFESAAFVDVRMSGVMDIVSGGFWYEGPDFFVRHTICDVPRIDDYYDDFGTVAMDITGNGLPDLVTGGWFGESLRWRENPGPDAPPGARWTERAIASTTPVEQPFYCDLAGDGGRTLVPNTPIGPLRAYTRAAGSHPAWDIELVWEGPQGHGLGFGDISGSGRGDFVMNHGWVEATADGEWIYHPEFDLGQAASVPILVVDINGDGLAELIVGNGHGYGLDWWSQEPTPTGRIWTKHSIDESVSQCHTLKWVDIDGDGQPELVTGKRWRAHPHGDPGNEDDLGVWYYDWTGDGFTKHVIDSGPLGQGVGVGIDFDVRDITGNGYPDIVAPGKDGLWLLLNNGPA